MAKVQTFPQGASLSAQSFMVAWSWKPLFRDVWSFTHSLDSVSKRVILVWHLVQTFSNVTNYQFVFLDKDTISELYYTFFIQVYLKKNYRSLLVIQLPALQVLDGTAVNAEERVKAALSKFIVNVT